jgi:hypothetical protein
LAVFIAFAVCAVGQAGAAGTAAAAGNQVLWRNANGDVVVWFVNGGAIDSAPDFGTIPAVWTIQGTGDFNGDGQPDILWRNANGDVVIWFMSGGTFLSSTDLGTIPTSWAIKGTGDFDGDGTTDILWRNTNGDVVTWFMNGGGIGYSADYGTIPAEWIIQGTGDFDGDGKTDILWRNTNGDVVTWLMNGGTIGNAADYGTIPAAWNIQGTGDFDGDGKSDILWRNTNGDVVIWFMNGGVIGNSADFGTIPAVWNIQGAADFNGDGKSDILWRNTNGDVVLWFMNGGTIGSSADFGAIPAVWNIAAVGPMAKATSNPGALAVYVQGSKFADESGNLLQLRGVNLSGMEFTAIGGWDVPDPTGDQMGQPHGPSWPAITAWRANVVRIPLNEASWLGLSCVDINGKTRNADPGGNYRQTLANLVQGANNAGLYVILDLHWSAPGTLCPMGQGQMMDADHSFDFWTSIANTFKNNPSVMFELFNEPYLTSDFQGNPWTYMMSGTGGGPFTGIPEAGAGNPLSYKDYQTIWNIASFQDVITAIRGTGATNVILVGALAYSGDLGGWLANRPNDPLNQMAAAWHPYPAYGTTWGTPAYSQPQYAPQVFTDAQGILAAGIPVIVTETGDQSSNGTGIGAGCALAANYAQCAPLVSTVIQFADQNGISVLGWTWDTWGAASYDLIKDGNGTPTDGYGQVFQSWLVNHQ